MGARHPVPGQEQAGEPENLRERSFAFRRYPQISAQIDRLPNPNRSNPMQANETGEERRGSQQCQREARRNTPQPCELTRKVSLSLSMLLCPTMYLPTAVGRAESPRPAVRTDGDFACWENTGRTDQEQAGRQFQSGDVNLAK